MTKSTGYCPRCRAPVYGRMRTCQLCTHEARRERNRQEIREAGCRAELMRSGYDSRCPRYVNKADAHGLRNIPEFLRELPIWDSHETQEQRWPKRPRGPNAREADWAVGGQDTEVI